MEHPITLSPNHSLQIPLFSSDYFSNYAPLLIVILCGCTYLNLGSALLNCCSACFPCVASPAFSFDEDFSDTRIGARHVTAIGAAA